MRRQLVTAAAAALLGGGLLLPSTASAIQCPPGTDARTVHVAGRTVTVCVPRFHCDPVGCDPLVLP